jgi:hypothetical protein
MIDMKRGSTVFQVLAIAGMAIFCVPVALISEKIVFQYCVSFETPGIFLARHFIPAPPPPKELSTLGERLGIGFVIDWLLCLVFVYALVAVARRFRKNRL